MVQALIGHVCTYVYMTIDPGEPQVNTALPASIRPHLEKLLDWDHDGIDTDLNEIAQHMLDWDEKLSSHLGLTAVDVHDIKAMHRNNPELQR